MKLMSFEEIVDRIRLPLDVFREKYAPDSIEFDTTPFKTYSLRLSFRSIDSYSPSKVIHGVVAHELFVENDSFPQHVILLENGTQIVYQECQEHKLLMAIKYKTPDAVEPVADSTTEFVTE